MFITLDKRNRDGSVSCFPALSGLQMLPSGQHQLLQDACHVVFCTSYTVSATLCPPFLSPSTLMSTPLLAAACQSRYKQDIQSPRSPTLFASTMKMSSFSALSVIFLLLCLHTAQPGPRKGAWRARRSSVWWGWGHAFPEKPVGPAGADTQGPPPHLVAFFPRRPETWILPRIFSFLPFRPFTYVPAR